VVSPTDVGFEVTLRFKTNVRGQARMRALRAGRVQTALAFAAAPGRVTIGPFPVAKSGFYVFEVRLAGSTLRWNACLGRCGEHATSDPFSLSRGLPVVVVNPRQVRDFARAIGQPAKTDALDAAVLALFAERVQPPVRPLPDADQHALTALVTRRRQLVDMLTAERNRLPPARGKVREDLEAHITWLEKRLKDTTTDLRDLLHASPVWRTKDELLQSVPGVGPITTASLLAHFPELGQLSRQETAALAGVAPLNCDTGARRGTRTIWGGRAVVRHVLYMATIVAIRHNPPIRAFYQRLCARGKARKVALVAAMRKLLTILNAILRTQRAWTLHALEI
jgi:transposase